MKKTMITLAAMFAATVSMAAVTSQIVGYQNIALPLGNTFVAATFGPIGGGTSIKLGSITANNYDPGSDFIQFRDGTLNPTFEAYYISPDLYVDLGLAAPGWYNVDLDVCYNDYSVDLGLGFIANIQSSETVTLGFAGQVDAVVTSEVLPLGNTIIGNPTPVAIPLGSITADNYDPGSDFIQFRDGTLNPTFEAYYIGPDLYVDLGLAAPGWYNVDLDVCYNDYQLAPGAGFLANIQSADATVAINFPNPIQ